MVFRRNVNGAFVITNVVYFTTLRTVIARNDLKIALNHYPNKTIAFGIN